MPIIHLLRDDLIHPTVQGNKWRKLHLLLAHLQAVGAPGVVSFGGAFSNSIHALAYAGPLFGLRTAAIIRGTAARLVNPTLSDAVAQGMTVLPVPKVEYDLGLASTVVQAALEPFRDYYVLPEGGATAWGIEGCKAIAEEVLTKYSTVSEPYLAVPAGTGTTAAGIIAGLQGRGKVLVFPAASYHISRESILELLERHGYTTYENFEVFPQYTLGKFAQPAPEVLYFARQYALDTGVQLDPFYTSRMLYGLYDLRDAGYFAAGSTVIAVHTGGLQAWRGMR